MEEQSQVEELQKSLQEQDSKADDVSNECLVYIVCVRAHVCSPSHNFYVESPYSIPFRLIGPS